MNKRNNWNTTNTNNHHHHKDNGIWDLRAQGFGILGLAVQGFNALPYAQYS